MARDVHSFNSRLKEMGDRAILKQNHVIAWETKRPFILQRYRRGESCHKRREVYKNCWLLPHMKKRNEKEKMAAKDYFRKIKSLYSKR